VKKEKVKANGRNVIYILFY